MEPVEKQGEGEKWYKLGRVSRTVLLLSGNIDCCTNKKIDGRWGSCGSD